MTTHRDKTDVESPVAVGELVDAKYRVERVIGSGGMGVVVMATHVELEQPVALKFLLPKALRGAEARARFLREARAAVRLRSEHVARVFDVGALPTGEPYSVMEYLDGCDLASYAASHSPLRVGDAVEFVLQACEAIVEAHALGIVHRDLKPQNLFMTRRVNGAPLVKVLDFGISKALGPFAAGELALTDSTVVLGSPLYMAPEQMKSARSADMRSDVWSLGVILYELLTGQVPFDGESMTELCLKVVNDPPPAPRELRGDLPEGLAATVMRCLEKDPAARFQNVATLAEALEGYSTSASRGTSDRAWRSLVDTADALDHTSFAPESGEAAPAPESAPKKVRTEVTWGDTRPGEKDLPPPSTLKRRRAFVGGLAAGALATLALGATLVVVGTRRGALPTRAAGTAPSVTALASEAPTPTAAASPAPGAPDVASTPASAVAPSASAAAPVPTHAATATHARPPVGNKVGGAHHESQGGPTPTAAPTPSANSAPNGAPILH